MSLLDRVQFLAGCSPQQARAVAAEVYRHIGEGVAMTRDRHDVAAVLLDAARACVQNNAAEVVPDARPAEGMPAATAELAHFEGEVNRG